MAIPALAKDFKEFLDEEESPESDTPTNIADIGEMEIKIKD